MGGKQAQLGGKSMTEKGYLWIIQNRDFKFSEKCVEYSTYGPPQNRGVQLHLLSFGKGVYQESRKDTLVYGEFC